MFRVSFVVFRVSFVVFRVSFVAFYRVSFVATPCFNRGQAVVKGLNNDDDLRMICDGYNDCSNGLDEMNCSNRFYCQDGQKSVYISQVTLKYLLLNKFLNYQK